MYQIPRYIYSLAVCGLSPDPEDCASPNCSTFPKAIRRKVEAIPSNSPITHFYARASTVTRMN